MYTIKSYKGKTGNTINIIHGDCMEYMEKCNKKFEICIVDPPYGIDVTKMNMGGRKTIKPDKTKNWDNGVPNGLYFNLLSNVSKNQIIWGGNYFKELPIYNPKLKLKKEFIKVHGVIWDKGETLYGRSFCECEIAYTTLQKGIYKTSPNQLDRIHPTQKPVQLYKWLLTNYAKKGDKILDTHGGSMSHAIACWDLGFDLDIIELDEEYYNQAVKRFEYHIRQLILF